jgi:hypothetical protein
MTSKTMNGFTFFLFLALTSASIYASPNDSLGVARLSFIDGVTSFLPASENKWVQAVVNRPLVPGDSLWTGAKSILELQSSMGVIRLSNQTNIKILNLNSKITQLKLSGGTLMLRASNLAPKQIIEISTPNLAFVTATPGLYRIYVNSKDNITQVSVIKGRGKVYGSTKAYQMNEGKSCPFGTNLKIYQCSKPITDGFSRWSESRDQMGKGQTKLYVSSGAIGNQDLDRYGRWSSTKKYGHVWTPNQVNSNWAPYRTGSWVWIRHWGWTWVDEQPWGFAPFHYGRWVYLEKRWSWVPGSRRLEPIYAPALVAFVGGRNFNLKLSTGTSGIAWFPLGPGDIYIPPGQFSRDYFININRNNTQISKTYINTIYNNRNTQITYQNITVVNGVSAVPTQTFVQSQPVNSALATVSSEVIINAPKNQVATVTPDATSVLGGSRPAISQPAAELLDKTAVVTTQPAAPATPFSAEQKLLATDPGVPLTSEQTEQLKPQKIEGEKEVTVNPDQTAVPISKTITDQAPTISDPSMIENESSTATSPQEGQPQNNGPQPQEVQPQNNGVQPQEVQPQNNGVQPQEVQPQNNGAQPQEVQPQNTEEQPQEVQPQTNGEQPQEVQPQNTEEQPQEVQPQTNGEQPQEVQPQTNGEQPQEVQPQTNGEQPQEVQPQNNGAQPQEVQPQNNGAQPQDIQPQNNGAQPQDVQPQDVQPQNNGAQPQDVQPQDVQPQNNGAQPQDVQPQNNGAQPQDVQPQNNGAQPQDVQPQNNGAQPQDVQPQNNGAQPQEAQPQNNGEQQDKQPQGQ